VLPEGVGKVSDDQRTPEERVGELTTLFSKSRRVINATFAFLPIFFTWLLIKNDLAFVVKNTGDQLYIRLALGFYFFSFYLATMTDHHIQQAVFIADPNRGRITLGFFAWVPMFVLAASVLLWASLKENRLAWAMDVFYVADIWGWINWNKWARPIIKDSTEIHLERGHYFRLERVKAVDNFLRGRWALYRFIVMLALLIVFNMICFNQPLALRVGERAGMWLGVSPAAVAGILPGVFLLGYFILIEVWIWFFRIRALVSLHVIDSLREQYDIDPKRH
jgi:hypothetical protein